MKSAKSKNTIISACRNGSFLSGNYPLLNNLTCPKLLDDARSLARGSWRGLVIMSANCFTVEIRRTSVSPSLNNYLVKKCRIWTSLCQIFLFIASYCLSVSFNLTCWLVDISKSFRKPYIWRPRSTVCSDVTLTVRIATLLSIRVSS